MLREAPEMLRTGTLVTPVAVYPFSGFSDAIAHADRGDVKFKNGAA